MRVVPPSRRIESADFHAALRAPKENSSNDRYHVIAPEDVANHTIDDEPAKLQSVLNLHNQHYPVS